MSLTIFRPRLSSESSSRQALWWVFTLVLVLHAFMTVTFSGHLTWFKSKPLPAIVIELGAAPPVAELSVAGDGGGLRGGGAVEAAEPVRQQHDQRTTKPSKTQPIAKIQVPRVAAPTTHAEQDAPKVLDAPQPTPLANVVPKSVSGSGVGAGTGTSPGGAFNSAGATDSVKTVEADYKPAYLNNPRPQYPKAAFRLGIEGTVIVWAEVGEDGKPLQIKLFKSSGNDWLDESALSTVAKWTFSPARKDGLIVRSAVKIPITFSLRAPH